VGSEVDVGSAGADDAGVVVDEGRVGTGSACDDASPVHPVTRSAAAAMPPYPRMGRR
jgi:hypothetical protein